MQSNSNGVVVSAMCGIVKLRDMTEFIKIKMIKILIFVLLQIVLFIPFYMIYRNDCKQIGKDNLAVSLSERFFYWLIFCPIWAIGFKD